MVLSQKVETRLLLKKAVLATPGLLPNPVNLNGPLTEGGDQVVVEESGTGHARLTSQSRQPKWSSH